MNTTQMKKAKAVSSEITMLRSQLRLGRQLKQAEENNAYSEQKGRLTCALPEEAAGWERLQLPTRSKCPMEAHAAFSGCFLNCKQGQKLGKLSVIDQVLAI